MNMPSFSGLKDPVSNVEATAISSQELDLLLDALTQANDRQLRLYELGRLNVEVFDFDATLDRLFSMALKLTDSESVALVDAGGVVVRSRSVYTDAGGSNAHGVGSAAQGVNASVLLTEMAANTQLSRCVSRSVCSEHTLRVNIHVGNERYVFGVGRSSTPYGTPDQKMFEAIATGLGSSLRLLALHDQAVANAMVEKEHAMAASIVASALPDQLPSVGLLETVASTRSARVVGGDFYVAVATEHGLRFVVGDVAGKGLPAAVLMSNAVTVANLVLHRKSDDDPVMFLEKISEAMNPMLSSSGRFITMVVGALTSVSTDVANERFELRLANAGHAPVSVVMRNSDGISSCSVPPLTPPVGVLPIPPGLQSFSLPFDPGAVLVVGSDGLADQENHDGEHFGAERLETLSLSTASARDLHDQIFRELDLHAQGTPRSDDQTLFVISSPLTLVKAANEAETAGETAEVNS